MVNVTFNIPSQFAYLLCATLAVYIFAVPLHAASINTWQLAHSGQQIKIYTRKVSGSLFLQTKGVVHISIPSNKLLKQFKSDNSCWQWQKRCINAHVIQSISNKEKDVYSVIDLPWPVADRDFVFRTKIEKDSESKVTTITFTPSNYVYPDTKYIRAKAQVRYEIKELSNASCLLTITMHTEFGGDLSEKLINHRLAKELLSDIEMLITLAE